ncbi:MAG: type VI secretion system baseplate subunit TssF [Desulfobacterales bacterium]|nr:type VI secretion system baseplate subunit TssF [Desulfobacterales bacterium]
MTQPHGQVVLPWHDMSPSRSTRTNSWARACTCSRRFWSASLAQYVSINSFTQFEVKTVQRKEALKKWPPRNGKRILI